MARNPGTPAFRPDIEGLRALAILVVVAFHCALPGFSGGFVGVDVFFVLSGYLISELLRRELEATSTISLVDFYARRVRRLLPASVLMLLMTLAVSAVVLAPQELEFTARAARATALYLGNVFFAHDAADYFAPNVRSNPLLHMWSLAVEEQFYLVWPLLMLLAWRRGRSARALAVTFAMVTALSFLLCVLLTAQDRTDAFYAPYTRAWEFGLGGLASLMPRRGGTARRWRVVGWAGMLLIILASFALNPTVPFPGWVALIPVLGTTGVLIAGRGAPGEGPGAVLGSRPLRFLGGLSYSWYLWHWPFLVLAFALLPNLGMAGRIVAVLAALLVAAVTHFAVENPIRFRPGLVARPGATLYLGGILMLGSLAAAFLALSLANHLAVEPRFAAISAAAADIAELPREGCVSLGDSPGIKSCVYGDASAAVKIALFGDSHAIQWFDALQRIAVEQHWRLITFLKSHCPAADLKPPAGGPGCSAWRAAVLRELQTLRPDLVVMASATGYLDGESARVWQEASGRTLGVLGAAGVRVAVMRDTPVAPFNVPTCLARSVRHAWYPGGQCAFFRAPAQRSAFFAAEQKSAAAWPGISFIDMSDAICFTETCPAVRDGLVVYRDDNHLTGRYAASVAPVLESYLLKAMAPAHASVAH